jgi:hypothetical protein
VRTATSRAEDKRTSSAEFVSALPAGLAAGASAWLTPAEGALLPIAGPTLALMNALRFLTDHVQGDVYFRIQRPGQNLDRHRAQLRLATHMLEALPDARRAVEAALAEAPGPATR